ncbi:lipopolysaccharide biosynthesis protein [Kribbia dieselivorans]|uniref:lipopolysaccharide biosynthesis protein n=1 Tax=Kribbia dieselivorans TaxID=331526 RepID=UPI000837E418|nr:oligosaccharide flippase family protein [Kribbia dieselivorans]
MTSAGSDGDAPSGTPQPIDPKNPDGPAPLSRGELQDRAIHGASWTLVNVIFGVGVGFLVNILLARVLGVVDYGRLAYLTMIIGLAGSIAGMGVGSGTLQFGAKAHSAGRRTEVQSLLSKSQGFRLMVAAPIMTVVVVALVRVDWVLLVLAVVFGIWVSAFFAGAATCLGIENKTAGGAKNALVINLLTQVAVVLAAVTVGTSDSIWAARIIVGALGAGTAMVLISPWYRRAVLRPTFPWGFPEGFWRFALPTAAAGLVGSLLSNRSEVAVLTWMSAEHAAGIFALAYGLSAHLFSPAQALIGPLIPAVSGLHEVDPSAVGRALGRTLRSAATVAGALMATIMPSLALLIPLIYGAEFAEVSPVMLVLAMGGAISILGGPLSAFVAARLQGSRLFRVSVISLALNVGLMVPLIPIIGIWGAVVGNIAGTLGQTVALLRGEVRTLGVSPRSVVADLLPIGVGGFVGWVVWWGMGLIGLSAVASAVLGGVAGGVLFLSVLAVARVGLTMGDVNAIRRAVPRIARGPGGHLLTLLGRRVG